jgi:lipoprotein-anchoring transpeptidase ErfK/SrfK
MTSSLKIKINLARQRLQVRDKNTVVREYAVSTAIKGGGEKIGSYQTPRGRHIIRAKIGAGAPLHAVFKGRRFTGEIYNSQAAKESPGRDWILSRILWLSGAEPGKNRLGDVDTMRRFIYIHGAPPDAEMGVAGSIGCIRMRGEDVVELFDMVAVGASVEITEN